MLMHLYEFYSAFHGSEGFLAMLAEYQSTKNVVPTFTILNGFYETRRIVALSLSREHNHSCTY